MRPRTGVAVVEVTAPLESFDFSTAERWEVLVLHESVPVACLRLPSPGPVDSADLARALIWPHADRARELSAAQRRPRAPLPGPAGTAPPAPACSVVVCTHGRPDHLSTALHGLARLDPAPLEIVVVDNDPGERDCEAEVRRRGFVYVREDRRGLDSARNAGVRAARGDLIVFTDDDCIAPTGWLRHVGEAFADPFVAAVTGPAFAYALDTPARVRMERQASLTRGLAPRSFDWTLISALHAGQVGVGANMAVRGDLLRAVHEPFPPELDAGTQTRSGGDTYVFARLLAAGHRIAYDPRVFVFHQHRADWRTLDDAVAGYGTGVVAALTKLLVEDGELEAPRAALWLLSQYARTQRRRLVRCADAVETRLAWSYVRGGLAGVPAWRRALRAQRSIDPALRPAAPFPPPTARPLPLPLPLNSDRTAKETGARVAAAGARGRPAISVVVPTIGRPEALARCLIALAGQTLADSAYEVIVVDDGPVPSVPETSGSVPVQRTGGRGAAVARNAGAAVARGDLLLFLDDDLVATPTLLERHVAAHEQGPSETVVIGYSPPRPPRPGLAALGAALWWEDHFRTLAGARVLSFTEALSGNVSIGREAFLAGRRFDPAFTRLRREDWEWGYRLLEGGARLHFEPAAVAGHEYELGAGERIRACRAEARGDVLLAKRHPRATPHLPLALHRPGRPRSPRAVLMRTLGHPRADAVVLPLLDVLERARLRAAWSALYRRTQRAAYAHELRGAGWRPRQRTLPPLLVTDAVACEPPPPSRVLASTVGRRHEKRHDVLVLPWPERWPEGPWPPETSPASLVAFMLPGRVTSAGWFEALAPAFAAPRVALAVGQLLDPGTPPEPLTLHEARPGRIPYAPLGGSVDLLVLRRDALGALRRASALAVHGPTAVALACVEDVLRSDALVARRGLHGVTPARPGELTRAVRERETIIAWGALLGEHALAGSRTRALAITSAVAAGATARTVLGRRSASAGIPAMDTSRAFGAGYVRAFRRRARRRADGRHPLLPA